MRAQKAFTLIELLVVIAIIALLLSIIIPSLGKAKLAAEDIVCKSNLRQYYYATEMYATEQDERYPMPWESLYKNGVLPGETERYCRWHNPDYNLDSHPEYGGPYWPYLAVTKANICPVFARYAKKYGGSHYSTCIGEPFDVQFSYSMNGSLRAQDSTGTWQSVKKSQVASSPSRTFLWAEENMWRLEDKNGQRLSNHVLNDNALLVTNGSPTDVIDCFGSFHKVSKTQLSSQLPGNPSQWGVYNSGTANVLFMDGSLSFATPLESKHYEGKIRGRQ
jgi:prepilin-type N-terminal cleavage/methylation domain-containing protein/prepilin-type processing-associated H-X9-DG protein